jgi:hypothetical protein
MEKLGDEIRAKCEELDINIQKLRNPRSVLLDIPEDIMLDNVEETLSRQNPEKDIKVGDIKAKFCCHKAGNEEHGNRGTPQYPGKTYDNQDKARMGNLPSR